MLLSPGRTTASFSESSFFASRFETGHFFEEECYCYEKEYYCFEKNVIPFTTVVFLWESVFSLDPKARPEGKKGTSAVVGEGTAPLEKSIFFCGKAEFFIGEKREVWAFMREVVFPYKGKWCSLIKRGQPNSVAPVGVVLSRKSCFY